MRNIYLVPLAVLLAAAGLSSAQSPDPGGSEPAAPLSMPGVYPPPSFGPALTEGDPGVSPGQASSPPTQVGPFCNRVWFDAEYLLWRVRSNQLPPLLTSGSASDAHPGALGQPGTSVLYGDGIPEGMRSGARIQAGVWFTDDHIIGFDASGFFIGGPAKSFSANSANAPILAVPFLNTSTNQPGALPLSTPGLDKAAYTAAVTDHLWGFDTNLRTALWRSDMMQLSLLAGFRYLELSEALQTAATLTLDTGSSSGSSSATPPGSILTSRFATRNLFYGGQLGADLAWYYRGFTLDFTGKFAAGVTTEIAGITGGTQVTGLSLVPLNYHVGLLTGATNIGRYSRNVFAWAPEAGLTVGYQFNEHFRLMVGYNFLYLSRAVRPANLIDTGVNPTLTEHLLTGAPVVGPPHPVFPGSDSSFWAQGLTAGLEFRF